MNYRDVTLKGIKFNKFQWIRDYSTETVTFLYFPSKPRQHFRPQCQFRYVVGKAARSSAGQGGGFEIVATVETAGHMTHSGTKRHFHTTLSLQKK